jgi:hypothetical protein
MGARTGYPDSKGKAECDAFIGNFNSVTIKTYQNESAGNKYILERKQ